MIQLLYFFISPGQMNETLRILGFVPLSEFVLKNMNLSIKADDIFIKCIVHVPNIPIVKALKNSDILSVALERCGSNNHLALGYNKTQKEWYTINTARNLLKSKKWAEIFDVLGFEYSVFVLINSAIVEKVGENFVMICGETSALNLNKEKYLNVHREVLFLGRCKDLFIDSEDAVSEILSDLSLSPLAYESIRKILIRTFSKYNKLPVNSILKNFFDKEFSSFNEEIMENALDSSRITNFLFLISKKFLKPIFSFKNFKILKGKIALLMQRNIYETLNCDDLLSYFSTKNFKLFTDIKDLKNNEKSKIILSLLIFLFNSIYLKIISMHFYSTTASFSRRKIYYFLRIHWNIKTTKFCSEYLENFEKTSVVGISVATLRCIPKNIGFRVITNCSSQSSYHFNLQNSIAKQKISRKINKPYDHQVVCTVSDNINQQTVSSGKVDTKFIVDQNKLSTIQRDFSKSIENIDPIKFSNINFNDENQKRNTIGANPSKIKTESLPISILSDHYKDLVEILTDSINKSKTANKNTIKLSSVNFKASPLLPILKNVFLKNRGFSLLRHIHIKEKIYKYLKTKKARLFLLKVDLKQCFDNIPQNDILRIIKDFLTETEYFYQEMQIIQVKGTNPKIEKCHLRRSPEILLPLNMKEAQPLSYEIPLDIEKGFILKENKTKVFNKAQILKMLDEVIRNTVVKYQNAYYKRRKGISQGCTISGILCAIYYAYLDDNFNDLNCFISRYVDDFLLITDDYQDIQKFLKIAESLKDKGFIINETKIMSNVSEVDDELSFKTNFIEWCGLKIFDERIAIKQECDSPFFRYLVSIYTNRRGEKIFEHLKRGFKVKFSPTLINMNNIKTGENIFDGIFYVSRKLRILFSRASFINKKFVNKILNYFKEEINRILKERGILFDSLKIENIISTAFKKSRVFELKERKFSK